MLLLYVERMSTDKCCENWVHMRSGQVVQIVARDSRLGSIFKATTAAVDKSKAVGRKQ